MNEKNKNNNKSGLSIKEISLIPIFAAVTAVLAQIAIPIPFSPVPISFGIIAVYISGILLKPSNAIWAQICYLALGAIGIPVFGNFQGGIGALLGPTGGYLCTYPIMAWIVSLSLNSRRSLESEKTSKKGMTLLKGGLAMFVAHIILYSGGTIWLSLYTGNSFIASLMLAVVPFIPLDIVKILFCIFAVIPFRKRLLKMNLLELDYISEQ